MSEHEPRTLQQQLEDLRALRNLSDEELAKWHMARLIEAKKRDVDAAWTNSIEPARAHMAIRNDPNVSTAEKAELKRIKHEAHFEIAYQEDRLQRLERELADINTRWDKNLTDAVAEEAHEALEQQIKALESQLDPGTPEE